MVLTLSLARRLLLCGACLLVGVAVPSGQAPPEQRVDIDELKAAIDAGATMLLIDVREDSEVESVSVRLLTETGRCCVHPGRPEPTNRVVCSAHACPSVHARSAEGR